MLGKSTDTCEREGSFREVNRPDEYVRGYVRESIKLNEIRTQIRQQMNVPNLSAFSRQKQTLRSVSLFVVSAAARRT